MTPTIRGCHGALIHVNTDGREYSEFGDNDGKDDEEEENTSRARIIIILGGVIRSSVE